MRKKQNIIDDKEKIISLYLDQNKTGEEIGLNYGSNSSVICRYLRNWGVKMRSASKVNIKHIFNENYFERIDTSDKAYFLGLLYADGCIKSTKCAISLEEGDKHILEDFKRFIGYNIPLYFAKKYKDHWKNQYRLTIYRKKFCDNLINLGCFINKTHILKFPTEDQVPKSLMNHFIRGYFDGDGCIYTRQWRDPNRSCIIFTSCMYFCQGLKEFLYNDLNITSTLTPRPNNIGEVRIYGINKIIKIIEYMYKESTVSLDRKRQSCEKLLSITKR